MRRLAVLATLLAAACTDVSSDPNAVVAIRFDGAAYPSVVVGDSLRDSLGVVERLRVTGLNFKGDSVGGAQFVFSSPDTSLRLFGDGIVFGRNIQLTPPARLYATVGSLQSLADTLLVVPRADSIKAAKQVDTATFEAGGEASTGAAISFQVLGDTAVGKPKAIVPGWLVSLGLRYHGTTIASSDTLYAFVGETNGSTTNLRRFQRVVDTTATDGTAGHRVFIRTPRPTEDTLVVIGTIRQRLATTKPITDSTFLIIRPKSTP